MEKEITIMKKLFAALLAALMALTMFAGCGAQQQAQDQDYSTMTIEELKPLFKSL